ncbi:MAG: ribosomal L7Ae/L30e/S12e/Gadd45 family protein [Cellulosilyticaceae bacterium]
MLYQTKSTNKIVGAKQTLKALQNGEADCILVAKDADARITNEIVELAKAKNVQVDFVDTMKQLGQLCNIEVKTAVAAIIH